MPEEIPPPISLVCRFLRTSHGLDVTCVAVLVYQTEAREYLLNTEYVVGQEEAHPPKTKTLTRWAGDKPVKEAVWEAVQEVTGQDKTRVFSPKEVAEKILTQYLCSKRQKKTLFQQNGRTKTNEATA